jgi:hypothetical protein
MTFFLVFSAAHLLFFSLSRMFMQTCNEYTLNCLVQGHNSVPRSDGRDLESHDMYYQYIMYFKGVSK